MERQSVEDLLRTFGLTEKEMEIFIFLSKQGIQKISQITNTLKINKGLVYRILKSLEQKGLVEATLEHPTRYIPIELEKIIDEYIKSIKSEATHIEKTKDDLLSDWKEISKTELQPSLETFSVIDGEKKVFHKIAQMVNETKQELISIATVDGLLRAEKYGVLDNILNHPLGLNLKIRYITNVTEKNINSLKYLMGKLESVSTLKGKHPELQNEKFPRLVIRDNEEILLFINDQPRKKSTIFSETVLHTNCKSIVSSFCELFKDIWSKSSNVKTIIQEIEEGKPPEIMELLKDPNEARKIFNNVLNNSKKEIFIVTSSKGLVRISKKIDLLKKWCKKAILIKIMAPITTQNLKAMQKLLEYSNVRHIPVGYTELTIIDNKNLFQFNKSIVNSDNYEDLDFTNVLYTNNSNYIMSQKTALFNLWKKMHTPTYNLQSISIQSNGRTGPHLPIYRMDRYGKGEISYDSTAITENDILTKIDNFAKNHPKNSVNSKWEDTLYFFGSRAFGLIQSSDLHSYKNFIVGVFQDTKFSSFGEENCIRFFMPPKKGSSFQVVCVITDNAKSLEYKKRLFRGMPGENNIILVGKNQLKIVSKKNMLFVGWTIDIPVIPSKFVLPPGCILFEAYGKVSSGIFNFNHLCERTQEVWFNHLDAFLTYFHTQKQYVGSGAEAYLDRNIMQISYPPPKCE
ncbi:MAG: helix-turn-helix domain-containing protein [Candidatus Bathyarchaeota archaeon]